MKRPAPTPTSNPGPTPNAARQNGTDDGSTQLDNPPADLKVAEAIARDVGRGFARIDPADMARLSIAVGDAVLIAGQRTTVCRAMPAFPDDRGRSIVQIDGVTRQNAGVGVGDHVTLTPTPCRLADAITLTPIGVSIAERDLGFIGARLDGLTVVKGDRIRVNLFGSRSAEFVAERVSPSGPVTINTQTALRVGATESNTSAPTHASYEDIGGLRTQVGRIREMIELPLRHPEVFSTLGIDPPKGVLLHGPPGCGKTLIARTIAHEAEAAFFTISGPEIIRKHYGESEKALREIWAKATKQGPSIVFIDEIDSIAPKRENTEGEVEKRVVAQLLSLMDGLDRTARVVVIAATNLPNSIDPALRRPGRFDREIEIPIPDRHGRRQILDIHSRGMPLDDSVDLDRIASITHGCVGADLEAVCREAAMACLRHVLGEYDPAQGLPLDTLDRLVVTKDHFERAVAEVEPSAIREVFVEVPNVKWNDIGGLQGVKDRLIEAVEWPMLHAETIANAGVTPPKGVLLAGPPGVGKTMIAKAVATETDANFISIKGPELLSKFVGESERQLRSIFRKARQAAPCIVFFDEIDALLSARGDGAAGSGDGSAVGERVLAQFLAEMDGVEALKGVLVLGATNRVDRLDPAMLRPGRFDHVIEISGPDSEGRAEIFQVHLRSRPLARQIDSATLPGVLASRTEGASGAQIAAICNNAGWSAVRRCIAAGSTEPVISMDDFAQAINETLRDRAA